MVQPNADELKQVSGLVEQGDLKTPVENVLLLSEIKQAHGFSKNGHTQKNRLAR
jgi:NADPH:quinone reductase-like Zn-dependent oxidoreductase